MVFYWLLFSVRARTDALRAFAVYNAAVGKLYSTSGTFEGGTLSVRSAHGEEEQHLREGLFRAHTLSGAEEDQALRGRTSQGEPSDSGAHPETGRERHQDHHH